MLGNHTEKRGAQFVVVGMSQQRATELADVFENVSVLFWNRQQHLSHARTHANQ